MAKGMSLDEFRNALASEATEKNENLEKELAALKRQKDEEIKDLKEDLEQYKTWVKQLGNRCYALTCGMFCLRCGIHKCKYALTEKELDFVTSYMIKNKMPRNPETYEIISKMVCDRREKH